MIYLILAFLLIVNAFAKILIPSSLTIDITSLEQCDTEVYPIQVANISVGLRQGKVIVSGTLSTSVELSSPIKAIVKVKRKEVGLWIEVPCVDKVGSCTYNDICAYGIPENTTCPKTFPDSVPCRCPIPEGTYTIPTMTQVNSQNYFSVYSGAYWAKVTLSQENVPLLGCYEIYFTIEDPSMHTKDNELIPIVELV